MVRPGRPLFVCRWGRAAQTKTARRPPSEKRENGMEEFRVSTRLVLSNLCAPIGYHTRGFLSSPVRKKICASPFRTSGRAALRHFCALFRLFLFVTGLQVFPLDFSYFHAMINKAGTGRNQSRLLPPGGAGAARRGCPVVSALSLIHSS